jgi:outer membrane receptor protein involved in Fe transport
MNDAIYSKSTLNVDTSFTWDYTDKLQFRIDALNLTNQTDNRFAYSGLPTVTKYVSTGRQVFAGVSFKY